MNLRKILAPVDLAVAGITLLVTFPFLLFVPKTKKTKKLLSFVPGASVDGLKEKYGDKFIKMFFEDNAGGYFEEVIYLLFPMPRKRRRHQWKSERFKTTSTVLERTPPLGIFYALGTVLLIAEAAWIARRRGVSLIRGHDPHLYAAMSWLTSVLSGVPFVFSVHTDYEALYKADPRHRPKLPGIKTWLDRMASFVLPRATLAIPIRESLSPYLLKSGVKRENIVVIPHGIDVSVYDACDDNVLKVLGIPESAPLIVSVGRITFDNYFQHIPAIAKTVLSKFPRAVFVLAGPGWDLDALKKILKEEKLDGSVLCLGPVGHEKIPSLWKKAAVALIMKGGFSLLEAGAAGCAVVSYDIEWHYELIQDGATGRLIKPDPGAAADAIIGFLEDNEKRTAMGKALKELCLSRHSEEAAFQARAKAYEIALCAG